MKTFIQLVVCFWKYQPAWARLLVLPLTLFIAALCAADEMLNGRNDG